MWLLVLASCLLFFWYFCITKRPEGCPPGPLLRLPLLGNVFAMGLGGDPMKKMREMRKSYGDIFHIDLFGFETVMVTEKKMMEDMFQQPGLSGRLDLKNLGSNFNEVTRGGNGHHGIFVNYGLEWQEQRRFILRQLRDLGFGKVSMEDIVLEECHDLCESLRIKAQNEEDVKSSLLFNNNILNVIWHMISSKRFDLNDKQQQIRLVRLRDMFEQFGSFNPMAIVSMILPETIASKLPFYKQTKTVFAELFDWFDQEYQEHNNSYDPNDKRDLIDAYIQERERANTENDIKSSFYGECGHWNFVNSMFDLFLAGAETTSTTLSFFILFMLHHPEVQLNAQEEIDAVVGRSKAPSLTDRDNLPYVEALIAEIHRRSTIAPMAVPHAALEDVQIGKYTIPKGTMVSGDLSAVMLDPAHFPNPLKFEPNRFYKDGKYQGHPALIPFGVGKRYCLGKSLANIELFLFVTMLLHQFTFLKSDKGLIGMDDVNMGPTRSPKPFFFRIAARN